jgi:predicted transposase/invertase (TIGR01784 family)
MKRDKLFYTFLKTIPRGFFELIGKSPDEANAYSFSSTEIKEPNYRIDGFFKPHAKNKPAIFVEAQMQRDKRLYKRLFSEVFSYIDQYDPFDWQAVVLYKNRRTEQEEHYPFRSLLNSPQVTRIYLDELPSAGTLGAELGMFKLIVESEKEMPKSARALLKKNRNQDYIDLTQKVMSYRFPNLTPNQIAAMLNLDQELLSHTRFYKVIKEKGLKEGIREGREKGIHEGREKGVREGKEKGIREGKELVAEKLFAKGFPLAFIAETTGLSASIVRRIAASKRVRRTNRQPKSRRRTKS